MSEILKGKMAVITGANQGFGLAIAQKYLAEGASIAICARNHSLLQSVRNDLLISAHSGQKVLALAIDVSNPEQVDRFIQQAVSEFGTIDILVNNAGIYGPKGEIEDVDWGDWVRGIEINLLGPVLLCRAVLPIFKAQRSGKIIQLSGGGATNPMPRISSYAVSKAGIVRFVETLAEEVREFGIDVNAIAPGALNTRLLDEVLDSGPEKVGRVFYERALKQKESGGSPLDVGVRLAVFLASDVSRGITGKLISAVWDRWEDWPFHLDELNKSDIYTLRRIVGKDRDMSWGDK
ncbi:MAG: SDR family oxidoreductase [Cylindrospermopsis raciborskii KL1]|jgi:NAD(P)-dependent dehydrogenase (short-subunit alcohol dehydrogenase family)|uniref:SDR family NAD(P)-dependent oxidoreductase n=1 Tax=Cylindrospermopsis raciborskii TaxID=77022 RepID=UPI001A2E4C45|nr:SDR family oxidoreductase [Cylindrospermopsis raciborskii]MBG0744583.1 SDR family oxidoreductase [Cylindrospermopsis raciborskii KL1]